MPKLQPYPKRPLKEPVREFSEGVNPYQMLREHFAKKPVDPS